MAQGKYNNGVAVTHQHPPNNKWSHSFWACCAPFDTCLAATCCSCCLFGKTQARLDDPNLENFNYCNGPCWGWGCLSFWGCAFIYQAVKRSDMRDRYGIEGSCFCDWVGAYFCPCCGLVQEAKEAKLRSEATTGYQPTQGMTYPQQ